MFSQRVGGSPGLTRIVVLLFQRRLLALRRSGRFLFRFGAGFFYWRCCLHAGDQGSDETLRLYLHLPEPHPECRLLMPVLPVPLVSFDFYQHFITRTTTSPGFMPLRRWHRLRIQAGQGPEYLRYSLCILYLFDVQRVINQILLLFLVNGHIPYRRRGGGWAACITQRSPKRNHFTEMMLAAVPCALVEGSSRTRQNP